MGENDTQAFLPNREYTEHTRNRVIFASRHLLRKSILRFNKFKLKIGPTHEKHDLHENFHFCLFRKRPAYEMLQPNYRLPPYTFMMFRS